MLARGGDHLLAFPGIVAARFLDVNVLAGGAGQNRGRRVPVIRRFAEQSVDLAVIENGSEIADRLRPLAVCTIKRSEALPDIPTVAEFVPGFEASSWFGIAAPKGTPAEIIERLNLEINGGLADPTIKTRLAEMGGTPLPGSPADYGKLIADETEKWGEVIRAAGIKAE